MNVGHKAQGASKQSAAGRGLKIAVVVSRFHQKITRKLRAGAEQSLRLRGVRRGDVRVVHCPGAFELPQAANLLARTGAFDAIVCLGAVVRGETPHFEYVSAESARGIQQVALLHALPVTFGVLTTDTIGQAEDRAGGVMGNKGWDAADAAVEMALLRKKLHRHRPAPARRT
ncbi:MAG TPA: 6,7-dimethyl-8-ribityllumazine synthase [Bacteroidetes bacterium]|nr:6,7-dimethyl-8-ribityllumazine synthase [Bacteroidota bacterium]